jgi:hypothetical protein
MAALARTAATYFTLLGEQLVAFTAAIGVLVLFGLFGCRGKWPGRVGQSLGLWMRQYPVLLPGVAALAIYALVGHVEGRLIGPFLVLLAASILAVIRIAAQQRQAVEYLVRACLWVLAVPLAINAVFDTSQAVVAYRRGEGPRAHPQWRVAQVLRQQGLRKGDPVGFVGFTFDAYWARLAGLQIVADVPLSQEARFWASVGSIRQQALTDLQRSGSRVVVARSPPDLAPGWQVICGTDYVYLPLGTAGGAALASTRVLEAPKRKEVKQP